MFSSEFFEVLKQILGSWQVIAVSVALIVYLYIVSYTARGYRTKRVKKAGIKLKKVKSKSVITEDYGPEEAESKTNINDELGLEEA